MAEVGRVRDLWLSGRGVLYYHSFLSRSQYWNAEKLREYQFNRCAKILSHAYKRIPYYKNAFDRAGFNPHRDFKSLEDLRRIPILSKQVTRREKENLADRTTLARALELRTSGSTGEFFREYVSPEHWVVEQATVWRHWSWLRYRFRDRVAIVRSYVPDSGGPLWKLDPVRNFLYFSAYHLTPENAMAYLRKMQAWAPQIVRGYASSLLLLARTILDKAIELPPLKGILTASETLLPSTRATIERAFGTRVFDWYGQAEATVTMNECEQHQGLHVNSEYGICELLDDPLLPAGEKRIIATSLHNITMPLIRYDTGDIAIVDAHSPSCPCGRTLPSVRGICGRLDSFLYAPDGRVIPSVNLYTLMHEFEEIEAFQFIQPSVDYIEVRVRTRGLTNQRQARLCKGLSLRFGDTVRVEIKENQEFEQTAEGKKNVVISKVQQGGSHRPTAV
jgi:phenylacetate-CoA ligase